MTTTPGSRTPFQLLSSVSQFVELRSIVLRRATAETTVHPEDQSISWSYRQRHSVRFELLSDSDRLRLYPAFEFAAYAADVPSNSLATLEAEYALTYELKLDANKEVEALKIFAEVNGPFAAWPYWRELVQTVTGRLGLPGVLVPVFKVDLKSLSKPSSDQRPGENVAPPSSGESTADKSDNSKAEN